MKTTEFFIYGFCAMLVGVLVIFMYDYSVEISGIYFLLAWILIILKTQLNKQEDKTK